MVHLKNALKYLGLVVNGLVDEGHFERVDEIETQMRNGNIMEYLISKYGKNVDFSPFRGGTYSIEELNRFFASYSGYIEGNEDKKYSVSKNGLCLITALCIEGIFNN